MRVAPTVNDSLDAPAVVAVTAREPQTDAGSSLLAEITAGLAAGSDLHALLGRFLDPIVRLAGAQAGAVRVLDREDNRMHLVAVLGLPDGVVEAERSVERTCGVCGSAMLADGPVWDEVLASCVRRSQGEYFGAGCERMLAVPLLHRGQVLGVYNLFYAAGCGPSPGVLALLRSVGEVLGLALENARLQRENLRATLERERRVMAADLHDSIGQSLTCVKMRLPLLHDAIARGDRHGASHYYDDVRSAVSQAHASLRTILTQFRTPMDPLGLAHALDQCASEFRRGAGVDLEVVNRVPDLHLGEDQEAQVFHVVREALSNIARHAGAHHARIEIVAAGAPEARALEVVVEDDGSGLGDAAASATGGSHYGMEIMVERARRLGGTLEVGPRRGGGTRVRLAFPLAGATSGAG